MHWGNNTPHAHTTPCIGGRSTPCAPTPPLVLGRILPRTTLFAPPSLCSRLPTHPRAFAGRVHTLRAHTTPCIGAHTSSHFTLCPPPPFVRAYPRAPTPPRALGRGTTPRTHTLPRAFEGRVHTLCTHTTPRIGACPHSARPHHPAHWGIHILRAHHPAHSGVFTPCTPPPPSRVCGGVLTPCAPTPPRALRRVHTLRTHITPWIGGHTSSHFTLCPALSLPPLSLCSALPLFAPTPARHPVHRRAAHTLSTNTTQCVGGRVHSLRAHTTPCICGACPHPERPHHPVHWGGYSHRSHPHHPAQWGVSTPCAPTPPRA